eukprot:5094937-Prymnesium_polylepis.1
MYPLPLSSSPSLSLGRRHRPSAAVPALTFSSSPLCPSGAEGGDRHIRRPGLRGGDLAGFASERAA